MGKGLLTLNPMHSDNFLFSNVSLAGLVTVLYAGSEMKTFFCGNHHYFLYYLVLSMYPKMLITVSSFFFYLILAIVERIIRINPNAG